MFLDTNAKDELHSNEDLLKNQTHVNKSLRDINIKEYPCEDKLYNNINENVTEENMKNISYYNENNKNYSYNLYNNKNCLTKTEHDRKINSSSINKNINESEFIPFKENIIKSSTENDQIKNININHYQNLNILNNNPNNLISDLISSININTASKSRNIKRNDINNSQSKSKNYNSEFSNNLSKNTASYQKTQILTQIHNNINNNTNLTNVGNCKNDISSGFNKSVFDDSVKNNLNKNFMTINKKEIPNANNAKLSNINQNQTNNTFINMNLNLNINLDMNMKNSNNFNKLNSKSIVDKITNKTSLINNINKNTSPINVHNINETKIKKQNEGLKNSILKSNINLINNLKNSSVKNKNQKINYSNNTNNILNNNLINYTINSELFLKKNIRNNSNNFINDSNSISNINNSKMKLDEKNKVVCSLIVNDYKNVSKEKKIYDYIHEDKTNFKKNVNSSKNYIDNQVNKNKSNFSSEKSDKEINKTSFTNKIINKINSTNQQNKLGNYKFNCLGLKTYEIDINKENVSKTDKNINNKNLINKSPSEIKKTLYDNFEKKSLSLSNKIIKKEINSYVSDNSSVNIDKNNKNNSENKQNENLKKINFANGNNIYNIGYLNMNYQNQIKNINLKIKQSK